MRNLLVVALHKCLILGQVLNILARVLQWHCCMFLLKFIFPATTDTFKPVSFPSLPNFVKVFLAHCKSVAVISLQVLERGLWLSCHGDLSTKRL